MHNKPVFSFAPGVPEQIADYLQLRIVQGELAPGQRIAEAHVTEALGVSRGPVREALRVLAARHLVEVTPRRGARVTPFGRDDVRGLYDMQMALLSLLVTRVADVLDPPMLKTLAGHRDRLLKAAESADTLAVLAQSQLLLRVASEQIGNLYLRDTLDRLAPAFSRAHFRALASAPNQAMGLAQFIDDLISKSASKDYAGILDAVQRYGEDQIKTVLATFDAPD